MTTKKVLMVLICLVIFIPIVASQTFAINGQARSIAQLIPFIAAASIVLFTLVGTFNVGQSQIDFQQTPQTIQLLIFGIIISLITFAILTAIVDAVLLVEL